MLKKKHIKKKRYLHSSNICTTQTNICAQGEKKKKKELFNDQYNATKENNTKKFLKVAKQSQ